MLQTDFLTNQENVVWLPLNRVTLLGNLGKDPDVRYIPDGTAVVTVSLATRRPGKTKPRVSEKSKRSGIVWCFSAGWPKLPVSL